MKRLLIFVLIAGLGVGFSQTSNVTATITDPDGQTWNNGSYTITFIPTPGVPGPYTWQGNPNFPQNYTGSFNNAGVLTVSIPDNNFIAPKGSKWQFTLCSNTSAPCQNVVTPVTGAAPNLSTALSTPLIAPRFGPGAFAFGYLDVEVSGLLLPGSIYFNVSNLIERQWSGTAWSNMAGGSGMVWPAGGAGIPVYSGVLTWGTTLPPPDGNASHCLVGTGAWAVCGFFTGVTPGGGLQPTGTTIGMLTTCTDQQIELWNAVSTSWVCASIPGGLADPGGTGIVKRTTLNHTAVAVAGDFPPGIAAGTAVALAATPTQCTGNNVSTGIAASGNANCSVAPLASTATALAAIPTQCTAGNWATGIAASGNANCSAPPGGVASVTGTANQISSTGGANPVLSIPNPFNPPGNMNVAGAATFGTSGEGLLTLLTGLPPANPTTGNITLYGNSTSGNLACLTSTGGSCLPTGIPTGTGVVRVDSGVGSAAELSGDVTTSGSNVASVVKVNGAAVPLSKTIVGTNGSGQIVDATAATLTNNTSGNAATASSVAAANVAVGTFATGMQAVTQPLGTTGADIATLDYVIQRSKTTVGTIFSGDYGVISRGGFITDVSVANGGQTITCPNNDCNFVAANVGDIVFMYSGLTTAVSVIPQTTILTVNSAQSITVASGTASQACTANCVIAWGPDSSTGLDNAFAAAANGCNSLQIQAGILLVQQPEFNYAGTCPPAAIGNYYSPNVYGSGSATTTLIPTPNFNHAAGHGCGTIGSNGCFFGVPFQVVNGLSIKGAGSYGASGLTNSALVYNNQGFMIYVVFDNWCPSCSGTYGYYQTGSEASGYFGGSLNFGVIPCFSGTNGGLGTLVLQNWPCTQSPGIGIQVTGNLKSIQNVFDGIQIDSTGNMDSDNDAEGTLGHAISVAGTLTLRHYLRKSNANVIQTTASTGIVIAENTSFPNPTGVAAGTFYAGAKGSQFIDKGGNTYAAIATPNAPALKQSRSFAQAAGASIALAYTSNLSGTTANPTLLQAFVRSNTGATITGCSYGGGSFVQDGTTQVNGTFQAASFTFLSNTSSAAATVTCTFSVSVTGSQIYITEWTGTANAYDGAVSATTGSGTTVSNGSFTTTNNADAVGFVAMNTGLVISAATCSPTSSCIVFPNTSPATTGIAGVYQPSVPIAGSTTVSGTQTTSAWIGFWFQIKPYAAYPIVSLSESITGTLQTAANWSTPAGAGAGQWGTSPSVGTCSGSSIRQICTITVGSGTVDTHPVLTVTQPTSFIAAPICDAQMVGGSAAYSLFSTGTVTTTTAAFTWQGAAAPAASSTITLKVSCSN